MTSSETLSAQIAVLTDRGMVRVRGSDSAKLLQGLVTNEIAEMSAGAARFAALLSPQGKIQFDFLVVREGNDSFRLETARDRSTELAKRLSFYKLRADADITEASADYTVAAIWNGSPACHAANVIIEDPRLPALGHRVHVSITSDWVLSGSGASPATPEAYHAHRIALGVPEGGKDYVLGDTFPHEASLDQLNGLSLTKGCYVGQEVVSRMEHRGTARKRIVIVDGDGDLPSPGTPVMSEDATFGTLGSVSGRSGLALMRLDRLAELDHKGGRAHAGGVPVSVRLPPYARFALVPETRGTGV